jgi:hypothetical protein
MTPEIATIITLARRAVAVANTPDSDCQIIILITLHAFPLTVETEKYL